MRIFRAALALAVLAAGGMGCTARGEHGPRLIWPNESGGGAGAALPNTLGDHPYSFGALLLCVDKPGKVTIESVSPDAPQGGFVVQAFATRPNPREIGKTGFGAEAKKLGDVGFDTSSVDVHTRCPAKPDFPIHGPDDEYHYTEIGVQVAKPATETTAQGHGLTVRYRSGDDVRTVHIDFSIVLCGRNKHDQYCT